MALSRVGCSPKVSNDINTSFWESIVHASFAKQSREPHLWIGKPTIHHRQEAYWRGHQVGAACGRGVSDIRRAIASRPKLTAGEVSQGGIKKTATPRVGSCGCECLQPTKTRLTVSRMHGITPGGSCQARSPESQP